MSDFRDILGLGAGAAGMGGRERKKEPALKKPAGVSREVWLLQNSTTNTAEGNPPLIASAAGLKQKRQKGSKKVSWSWKPFQNSARTDKLELSHWVKEVEGVPPAKDYSFSKYNKHVSLIMYNDEEYASLIAPLDPNWNRVETDHLMELCKLFDLRFPQMQDRWEYEARTVEELKQRYFAVSKKLLEARAARPEEVAANPIVAVGYNYNHEKERKRCLAYLLSRTPGQSTEEAAILEEAAAAEERRRARAATMPVAAAAASALATEAAANLSTRIGSALINRSLTLTLGGGVARDGIMSGFGDAERRAMEAEVVEVPDVSQVGGPLSLLPPASRTPVPKPEPGAYLRSKHAVALGSEPAIVGELVGAKRVDAVCAELGLKGKPHATTACSRAWLQLRFDIARLLEMKQGVQAGGDTGAVAGTTGCDSGSGAAAIAGPSQPIATSTAAAVVTPAADPAANVVEPVTVEEAKKEEAKAEAKAGAEEEEEEEATTMTTKASRGRGGPKDKESKESKGEEEEEDEEEEEEEEEDTTPSSPRSSKRGGSKRKVPAPARLEDSPPRSGKRARRAN